MTKQYILTALITISMGAFPFAAIAATCASGPYTAGCAGPNGAVAVHKAPYYKPPSYYHPSSSVKCANGVYRAGCVGPNGAAVVRKQY